METEEQLLVSDKLMNFIDKPPTTSSGQEHKDLISTLLRLQYASIIAENRSTEDSNKWLIQLDYILDKVNQEMRPSNSEDGRQNHSPRKVLSFFSPSHSSTVKADKMKKIKKMLDTFLEQKLPYVEEELLLEVKETIRNRETLSIDVKEVQGRVDEKNKIVTALKDQSSTHQVHIIPFVGAGGIGKTTLAQLVFNDESVTQRFERRIWVYVSIKFDLKKVLRSILAYATGNMYDNITSLDGLRDKLSYELSDKRFLIVLDDVWNNGDDESWKDLRNILEKGRAGSKVILTTRSARLAKWIGNVEPILLEPLSEKDCLSIFESKALKKGEEANPKLVAVGEKIVKKYNGMPFAAKSLGVEIRIWDVKNLENKSDEEIEKLLESKVKPPKIEILIEKLEAVSSWRKDNTKLQEMGISTISSLQFF